MAKAKKSKNEKGADRPVSHFYVANDLVHLNKATSGMRTWWCVSRKAKPGAMGLVYHKGNGLKLAFRVMGPRDKQEAMCTAYGLVTANVEVIAVLESPLPVASLKKDRVLVSSKAVRRNFQSAEFVVEPESLSALIGLLGLKEE